MSQRDPSMDEVGFVRISHLANGGISVSGFIGDRKYALSLIAAAADAIRSHVKETPLIVIPNRDVDTRPYTHETKPLGDMPRKDWGDR